MIEKVMKLMLIPEQIRNISVSAHIDHGKTTFTDNLLAGAGMMSEELAGHQLVTDFRADEQARGITIDAANVSMVHQVEGKEFLINLIDTPGHVDFGGDVTRAMRAVDGTIVLVDAVEGMMPQTETVLRQALKEKDKPILFINKVDRLIKELKLAPEKMQERFVNIIMKVNKFIAQISTDPDTKWSISVQDGSVCFGSAIHNWGMSLDFMQKKGISFKDIIDAYEKNEVKELAKKAPLHEVVLTAVVKHLPNPVTAQKYRIPKIWHGDIESEMGKSLASCNPKGPAAFIITKIVIDKHAGEVCAGRLFSGTIHKGDAMYLNLAKRNVRIQQVSVYKAAQRIQVEKAVCGNIIGLVGLADAKPGETVSSAPMEPFEALTHIFEPVVTKAIEATKPSDLPKLIEVLRQVNKEDPSIVIEINEETGEHLMSGMGELHLEVIENRIKTEKGVEVKTSSPIVVYRETITKKNPFPAEGKSPNKHNKLYFTVEPLSPEIVDAIKSGKLPSARLKKKDDEVINTLKELGMDNKEARDVKEIFNGNMLVDGTRGIVHIGEIMEMVLDMFEDVMKTGPIAREPCTGIKVTLNDCKLHEDTIHRGPGQLYPAVREGIRGAMMTASPLLFEPVQKMQFGAPAEYMGELSKLVANKRGQLIDMQQEADEIIVIAKLPVAETFGLSNDLRSTTGGRGTMFLVDQSFERLPNELQNKIIAQIRTRKGLGENQ
ncbi:elongation factor EF-2 [Candidatus Woesearchaeota archaeon]|nr:elongation factor EF-2 [Candidatus Woesearchaeota archaeon]